MTRRLLRRGGDRRSGDAVRVTRQLTRHQCEAILHAVADAWAIGKPFNRFLTLLWEHGGIDPRENGAATARFRHHVQGFLAGHGETLAHCWVQECGSEYGAHVHMLAHVPPHLDPLFRPKPLHWTKLCLPGPYVARVVECQRIAFARNPEGNAAAYRADLMSKVHYMLKCAPADLEPALGMHLWRSNVSKNWGRSGVTFGKRSGRWQPRKT
tara:strand:- start:6076 stop:6708 length:633 start_codon:yes stop_codon:yes gene_type:complete